MRSVQAQMKCISATSASRPCFDFHCHPVECFATTSAAAAAGSGAQFQLGSGSSDDSNVPIPIADGSSATYRAISCGNMHTCALRSDGQMVCFGENAGGKCGDGTNSAYVQTPTPVGGGIAFNRIAAGGMHTCGLRASDGRAMCFGAWGRWTWPQGGCLPAWLSLLCAVTV